MNSMQLKDKLKNISKSNDVDFNTLLRLYMYETFIRRLSVSKYRDNFILKGGFYLSTLFGVENRFTQDIDVSFKNNNFNEENIVRIIKEIISINLNDNIIMTYLGVSPIRDNDEYGGFRIDIQVNFENIREKFHIDICTGDPITPKEIVYNYNPILCDETIKVWAYNIETVLAEKLETILSRLEINGRMRDFYDVYLIYSNYLDNINIDHLKKAIEKTFKKRDFYNDVASSFSIIKSSKSLKERWIIYQRRFDYAKDIEFEKILGCIEVLLEKTGIIVN